MSLSQEGTSQTSGMSGAFSAPAEVERARSRNRQLEEQIQALSVVLQGVANTLSAEVDLPPLLQRITQVAVRLLGADVGAAFTLDPSGKWLMAHAVETAESAAADNIFSPLASRDLSQGFMAAVDDDTGELHPHASLSDGVVGHAATTGELTLIANAQDDPRFSLEQIAVEQVLLHAPVGALLAAPMVFKGAITGVLELAKAPGRGGFDAWTLDLVRTLAAQGAVAVTNARLYRRLRHERNRIGRRSKS